MGTKVYFFSNDKYTRFDRVTDCLDADSLPAKPIDGNWPGLKEHGFDHGIDTIVNWENGKLYVFKGAKYLRYDIASDTVDSTPRDIADGWSGLAEAGFSSDIDAAVVWTNSKAYFFKGDRYIRYDLKTDKVDDIARQIVAGWNGFTQAGWTSGVDAVVKWGDGNAYFFKDSKYLRFDIAEDKVAEDYPKDIAGNWQGLQESGQIGKLTAVFDLLDLTKEIWLSNAELIKSPVNGPVFAEMPWRGVLHTTEGSNSAGAINSFKATNFWPHFTIDLEANKCFQHIPLNRGSRALSDHGVKANAANAIQIEIVGFAEKSPERAEQSLLRLSELVTQIQNHVPIPSSTDRSFLDAAGVNRTPANRMNSHQWGRFSGWCGHQHVPGEAHWDPGAMNVEAALSASHKN